MIKNEKELERLKSVLRPAVARDLILHWAEEVRLFWYKPLCRQHAGTITSMQEHVNCKKCLRAMSDWE